MADYSPGLPLLSVLWCWRGHGTPATAFEQFAEVTDRNCDVILVAPREKAEALAALPGRFARQRVAAFDSAFSTAVLNQAAAMAAAPWLVVVPGDVTPGRDWAAALLRAVHSQPTVDAWTPRVLAADGSIAAAGSVLWRDGRCEPYGSGLPADYQEFDFRRAVPAAPLAGFVVRRAAFEACRRFDERYGSPEYAVVDLCVKLRDAGGRVEYAPRVTVTQTGPGADLWPDDARRLAERWEGALAACPERLSQVTPRLRFAARDSLCTDRLLIVDDRVPGADRGSGDPRMLRLLLEIVALWPSLRVTFVALRAIEPERYAPPLTDAGIEVLYGCADWPAWFYERRLHYGAVMISRPQPIDALIRQTQPQAFRIYDAEAFVFRRLERMLPYIGDRDQAREVASQLRGVRDAESEYLASSDLIFCVSHEERRAANAIAQRVPAVVIPHRIDVLDSPPPFEARTGILYFGGFMAGAGSPNEDALMYLVREILPLLHAEEPLLKLWIVGADPTPAIRALASDAIRVIGYVPDANVWLSKARVHLAPMRFGSGVKLKLIDTMAAGLPFVTTTVGAEGLRLGGLRRTMVSDAPETLARLTLDLYRDAALWARTQQALIALATRHFSASRFRQSLTMAMAHAGFAPPDLHG